MPSGCRDPPAPSPALPEAVAARCCAGAGSARSAILGEGRGARTGALLAFSAPILRRGSHLPSPLPLLGTPSGEEGAWQGKAARLGRAPGRGGGLGRLLLGCLEAPRQLPAAGGPRWATPSDCSPGPGQSSEGRPGLEGTARAAPLAPTSAPSPRREKPNAGQTWQTSFPPAGWAVPILLPAPGESRSAGREAGSARGGGRRAPGLPCTHTLPDRLPPGTGAWQGSLAGLCPRPGRTGVLPRGAGTG